MDGVLAVWENCSIEETFKPGFFRSREPMHNVVGAVKSFLKNDNFDVYVLSSTYTDNHSAAEKAEWNAMFTSIPKENQIYIPYGKDKCEGLNITVSDILIDDFTENLRKWPGTAIKLYNGINGTKGSWNGFSCHSNMTPELLYLQILAIARIVRCKSI